MAVGLDDVLAADGEDVVAAAEPETFVLIRSGVVGCRIEEDVTVFLAIVPFRCGALVAEGLVKRLEVDF